MGRLPSLPRSVFDSPNTGGYQRLDYDYLAYCNPPKPPVSKRTPLSRMTLRSTGVGLQPLRLHHSMQALTKPRRHRRHAEIPGI